jgi:hypothetical protein
MTTIVDHAKGMPRPINLMAYAALEQGLGEALAGEAAEVRIGPAVLRRALQREGNLIFNRVTADARGLLEQIFRRAGYVSGAELDALSPSDGILKAIRDLDDLSREDAVLRLEDTEGAAFAVSPSVEVAMEDLSRRRDVYLRDHVEILILDADTITPYLAGVRPLRDLLAETHRRHVLRMR